MAECHPVGLPVGDGGQAPRRDGHPRRPAVHPHQRGGRPARADPRRHRHRVPRRPDPPRAGERRCTSRSTSSPTRTRRRSCARTSATPRTSTGCSPASTRRRGTTTRRPGSTRAPTSTAAAGQPRRRTRSADPRAPQHGRRTGGGRRLGRRADRTASRTRDETLQHPRCVFQVLKRHFARYTPEMVHEICGIPPELFLAGRRGADPQLRAGADERVRATRSAGPSTPSARSTSAPRRSCRCCWATSAAPAAASWRCAGTPASRAPPTSRRCSTCCPATSRCRTRTASRPRRLHRRRDAGDRRASGATCDAYVVSLLKAWWGDAATRGERLLLRLPAPAHRRPLHLPHRHAT